jgi:flagellar protein FliO/FliZ
MTGAVLQMFASLAVVVGIIYLLYYASNRWFKGLAMGKGGAGLIRIVETKYLAPKRSLLIVEVAGEYLLLGNSGDGMSLIKKLELDEDTVPAASGIAKEQTPEVFLKKFDGMLDKALNGLQAVMDKESHKKMIRNDGEEK